MAKASSVYNFAFRRHKLDDRKCPPKHVLNIDGSCSIPDITQKVFVYGSPHNQPTVKPKVPKPKIEYSVVVIKQSESEKKEPIVVPPPQRKTVVLVLNKESKQKVIEVDAPSGTPEVFFVNYKDGDNPILPGGIDLKTALEAPTVQNVNVVDHGGSDILENNPFGSSKAYQNDFKSQTKDTHHLGLTQPLLGLSKLASSIEEQILEWPICPTCSSQVSIDSKFPPTTNTWFERPTPNFAFNERKQEITKKIKNSKKAPSKVTLNPPSKTELKDWNPFVPSNRVYAEGISPTPGIWRRLDHLNDPFTLNFSKSRYIKQAKPSSSYKLQHFQAKR